MKDLSNENIIHVRDGNTQYLQFRKLLEFKDKITHCFTLKNLNFYSNNEILKNKEDVKIN